MSLVESFNRAMTAAADLVCRPLQSLPPIWALAALSFVAGIAMVWIFGRVSDQRAIRLIRDRVRGNLLGVRIYRHDVGIVMGLQGRIFRDTGAYMKKALAPLLLLIVPMVIVMAQLNLRFAVRPLAPGETALVKAFMREPASIDQPVTLEAPAGVTVETPPVRIPPNGEVAWRIRAKAPGRHTVRVHVGDAVSESAVVVAEGGWGQVPQRSTGEGFIAALLYPGGTPMPPDRPVKAIETTYPPLSLGLLGLELSWIVWFFVLSMVAGFALKGVLGVEL